MMILKQVGLNTMATLVAMLAPLLVIPSISSSLGVVGFGELFGTIAFVSVIYIVFEFGVEMAVAREIAEAKEIQHSIFICAFFVIRIITAFFACLVLSWVYQKATYLVLPSCLLLIGLLFKPTALYHGMHWYGEYLIDELVGKGLYVASVLGVVYFGENNVDTFALFVGLAVFAQSIWMWIRIFVAGVKKIKLGLEPIFYLLKKSAPYYLSRLPVSLQLKGGVYFASFLLDPIALGIYAMLFEIYKFGHACAGAVARVLFTSIVNTTDIRKLRIATFVTIPLMLGATSIAYQFGDSLFYIVFSADLEAAGVIISIITVSILFVAISSYWGFPYFSTIGNAEYAHLSTFLHSSFYFLFLFIAFLLGNKNIFHLFSWLLAADAFGMLVRMFFIWRLSREEKIISNE